MIFVGSVAAWDLETLATASSAALAETPSLLGVLAVLWSCLLIIVSGLQQNTWFLVFIEGIGMVQNIYATAATRPASTFNLSIIPYSPLQLGRDSATSRRLVDKTITRLHSRAFQ
ncbi:hypothetical protein V8C35DRAFT_285462 [Trichoderma chlorosporum]